MAAAGSKSQTAQEYIQSQLDLEQEAREALPYQFDTCTRDLGPLRQNLFSCLTCNPPPSDPATPFTPAGVCYACSISCHGEHELVELFSRRDFECDCGTKRLPETSPCSLRLNIHTGRKGEVHSQEPCTTNKYNHNFKNRFCGCGELYDPHTEKGTMFQCVGLAAEEDGGCGEDWWHAECLMGLPRSSTSNSAAKNQGEAEDTKDEESMLEKEKAAREKEEGPAQDESDETPLPPGFPAEDDFEHMICYKCVETHPWIKYYAGSAGFLQPLLSKPGSEDQPESKKRKAEDDTAEQPDLKRVKADESAETSAAKENAASGSMSAADETTSSAVACIYPKDSHPPATPFSLFLQEDFRSHLCKCPDHFPLLPPHPALLDDEDVYEPPVSESGSPQDGAPSQGSRSIYDQGEAALSNVDRVRAIEGVMAYNNLRDKVKGFLKPFAESGEAVSAEAIKQYFEKLRGDATAARDGQPVASGADEG